MQCMGVREHPYADTPVKVLNMQWMNMGAFTLTTDLLVLGVFFLKIGIWYGMG